MGIRFPEANYFIAGSRFRPGMDGGYTIAALRRAQHFAEQGGVRPVLLTFDFWPDYDSVVQQFISDGLMDAHTVLRNLLQDARSEPEFLRSRAVSGPGHPEMAGAETAGVKASADSVGSTDSDALGRPWRTIWKGAAGAILHTDFLDLHGRPIMRVPYVSGRADWHRAPLSITVFGQDGSAVGTLAGFAGLYAAWMGHVFETSPAGLLNVVVCESRQVGELLAELPGEDLRLVHTIHSAHTAAPYQWDSAIDGLWSSWFNTIDRYDAVLWPTERQRAAVERRFGPRDHFWVVPHATDAEAANAEAANTEAASADAIDAAGAGVWTENELHCGSPALAPGRDPNLAIVIGRLVPLKRVDHTLDAFRTVLADNPNARLALYGEGPDERRLRQLAEQWGIADAVEFWGFRSDAAEVLRSAAVLVLTSTYEGQSLVTLEALTRGCPVVAYDVNYGPSEMIAHGEGGFLVPDGDVEALAGALGSVLGHPERLVELSRGATASAERFTPEQLMGRMAQLFETVVSHPRRRTVGGAAEPGSE